MSAISEEVIRASEAKKHRAVLKAINAGTYRNSDYLASRLPIQVQAAPAAVVQEWTQNNTVHMQDRDPRTVMRQLNREFKSQL